MNTTPKHRRKVEHRFKQEKGINMDPGVQKLHNMDENWRKMKRKVGKLKVQKWIVRIWFRKDLGDPGDPWEPLKYPETPKNNENPKNQEIHFIPP